MERNWLACGLCAAACVHGYWDEFRSSRERLEHPTLEWLATAE
jgi:hypothetical protein